MPASGAISIHEDVRRTAPAALPATAVDAAAGLDALTTRDRHVVGIGIRGRRGH
jgi:hypothetical protein